MAERYQINESGMAWALEILERDECLPEHTGDLIDDHLNLATACDKWFALFRVKAVRDEKAEEAVLMVIFKGYLDAHNTRNIN